MKTRFAFVLALALPALLAVAIPVRLYPGLWNLFNGAPDIAVIRIQEHLSGDGQAYDSFDVAVLEVFKGSLAPGTNVTMALAHVPRFLSYGSTDSPFQPASCYLVFLEPHDGLIVAGAYRNLQAMGSCVKLNPDSDWHRNTDQPPLDQLVSLFAAQGWQKEVAAPVFDAVWLERVVRPEFAGDLSALVSDLRQLPANEGQELQRRLFDRLSILGEIPVSDDESPWRACRFPSEERLAQLDTLLGEGASAEFAAHWLWEIRVPGGIRASLDYAVADRLVQMGPAALPALYRLLETEGTFSMPPGPLDCKRLAGRTIAAIGDPSAIPILVEFFQRDQAGADLLADWLKPFGYSAMPVLIHHLSNEDSRVREACWKVLGNLTGQALPAKASEDPVAIRRDQELFRAWWERKRDSPAFRENPQLLLGEPVTGGIAVRVPDKTFACDGRIPFSFDFVLTESRDQTRIVLSSGFAIEVVDPDGAHHRLFSSDKPLAGNANPRQPPSLGVYPPPVITVFPGSIWFKQVNGEDGRGLFDKPGEYRLRLCADIAEPGRTETPVPIASPWSSVWRMDPNAWRATP